MTDVATLTSLLKQALEMDSDTVVDFDASRKWRLEAVAAVGGDLEAEKKNQKEYDDWFRCMHGPKGYKP